MNKLFRAGFRAAHFLSYPLSGHLIHNSRRSRVIVIVDGSVLLIRGTFGKQQWGLPGGGMHRGEDQYHAAARELREETNVVVDPADLGLAGEVRLPKNRRWPVANIHFFECKLASKPETKIIKPLEIFEIGWFPLQRLPENRSETVDEGLKLMH